MLKQQKQRQKELSTYDKFLKWFASWHPNQHQRYFKTDVCQQCLFDLTLEESDIDGDLIYNQQLKFCHIQGLCYVCAYIILS
jgi:hypothetical protein